MLNEFDEGDLKDWFKKNEHIDMGNLLIQEDDDIVTIVLMGSKEEKDNPKFIGAFQMYFNYTRVIFFKQEKATVAKNEMKLIQDKNPRYDIQYIEGFGPFRLPELNKPNNRKRQMGLIEKKNIREGGQNIHPFQCILFTGVHSVGLVVEKQIK